ncbi:hypothetical protein [Hymenobacter psychrotolerans]|uniref:Uncharacterized protein n=1 Tax=Hymenobacter psychrotolerans DSM 18569 TaxID=1121959 RepID=A0A1M6S3S4_9BACT|nr:hypothetical protein [Hymenobacter psychrotolerans]SHK39330.1 hypothetical protein SAMN02746009_00869 [Hymenobacter psychrotolerans DSM 18569]
MRPSLLLSLAGLLAASLTTACKKDADSTSPINGELVFGQFYGFCEGERCIDIYRLNTAAGTVEEDTTDRYPSLNQPYTGQYVPLQASHYAQVRDLPQLIPAQLLQLPNGTIGAPDATDAGGYYLSLPDAETPRFWLIDTQKRNIPADLHPLVDTLRARIQRLP